MNAGHVVPNGSDHIAIGAGENTDLISSFNRERRIEIAGTNRVGGLGQRLDRPDEIFRKMKCHRNTEYQEHQGDDDVPSPDGEQHAVGLKPFDRNQRDPENRTVCRLAHRQGYFDPVSGLADLIEPGLQRQRDQRMLVHFVEVARVRIAVDSDRTRRIVNLCQVDHAAAGNAFQFLFKDQIVVVGQMRHGQSADGRPNGSRVRDHPLLLVPQVQVARHHDHHDRERQKQAGHQQDKAGAQAGQPGRQDFYQL